MSGTCFVTDGTTANENGVSELEAIRVAHTQTHAHVVALYSLGGDSGMDGGTLRLRSPRGGRSRGVI